MNPKEKYPLPLKSRFLKFITCDLEHLMQNYERS